MKDNHIKKNTVQFEKIRSGVSEFFDEKRQLPRLIKTGFNTLDEMLGGGLASGLNVLGAKPGSGKTSLVLQMAEHFSSRGVPVLYFSLEMSRNQINAKSLNRNLWRELGKPEMKKERKLFGGITSRDFIFRDLRGDGENDRKRFEFLDEHVRKTAEHNLACLYVIEPGRNFENAVFKGSVSEIKGIIKNFIPFCKEHHRNRQPVVIIDYLQIVSSNKEYATERQNVDAVIHELFELKTNIPIILISSLNRSSYTGEKKDDALSVVNTVNMGSFKESGNIEFSAEVLIGMQDVTGDDTTEPRKISLKLLKHRYGQPNREVILEYDRQHDLFTEGAERYLDAMGMSEQEIAQLKEDELLHEQFRKAVGKMSKIRWEPK